MLKARKSINALNSQENKQMAHLAQNSPKFLALWPGGDGGRGDDSTWAMGNTCAQLHLCEQQACEPATSTTGAHAYMFSHCLHKWGWACACSPLCNGSRLGSERSPGLGNPHLTNKPRVFIRGTNYQNLSCFRRITWRLEILSSFNLAKVGGKQRREWSAEKWIDRVIVAISALWET